MRYKRSAVVVLLFTVLVAMLAYSPVLSAPVLAQATATASAPTSSPTLILGGKLDAAPRIAVESAFRAELELLLSRMETPKAYVANGRVFTTGTLEGKPAVAFLSGVSMVNAAMTTQQAFDYFNVTHLLFSGIAGGVNPNLAIGDVVVPAQWAEYQETTYARENPDGSFSGKSDLPNFGMAFPSSVSVVRKSGEPDKTVTLRWFPVDTKMLQAAETAASQLTLNQCGKDKNNNTICLDHQPQVKAGGNGVSGPTFVDNKKFREYVWQVFQADSLDMESAAVAHVAYVNEVPFLVFRSLSDLAGGGPGENEINTFFAIAADNSANLLLKFLQAWTPEPAVPALVATSTPTESALATPTPAPTSAPSGEQPTKIDLDKILPPGKGRDLLLSNCTSCHSWVCAVLTPRSAGNWQTVKRGMSKKVPGMIASDYDALFDFLIENMNESKPAPDLPPELAGLGCSSPGQ